MIYREEYKNYLLIQLKTLPINLDYLKAVGESIDILENSFKNISNDTLLYGSIKMKNMLIGGFMSYEEFIIYKRGEILVILLDKDEDKIINI